MKLKHFKKTVAIAMAALSLTTAFASCSGNPFVTPDESDREVNENMTQLYVGCYAGGYGRAWLDSAIARFEEQYKTTSFESGKEGVQVHVDYQKSYANLSKTTMGSMTQSVIFTEQLFFNEYTIDGKFLDITDIVTSPLSDVSDGKETGTIEAKLSEAQQKAYKAFDGKYYCLPHYESFPGLTIDADLWKENFLYVADTELGNSMDDYGCCLDDTSILSKGPDGEAGTYDDGLPATYDEFFNVCEKMVSLGIDPFIWTGGFPEYFNLLPMALYADGAGAEAFSTTYDFDSNGEEIEIYNEDMQKEKVVITNENAYLMRQQTAKYDAINFVGKIVKEKKRYVNANAESGATTHEGAQRQFVAGSKKIGFLIEGNYWYNEAAPVFKEMVADKGNDQYSADNRNFQWIPLPRAERTAAADYKITTIDRNYSCAFINANVKGNTVLESLSKLFLKFCYTKDSLVEFTVESGATKGVDYQLTDTEEAALLLKLNTYEKSFWNFRSNANVLYPISDSQILMNNQRSFNLIESDWTVVVGDAKHVTPYDALKSGVSAENYFKAGWISASAWKNDYQAYFE